MAGQAAVPSNEWLNNTAPLTLCGRQAAHLAFARRCRRRRGQNAVARGVLVRRLLFYLCARLLPVFVRGALGIGCLLPQVLRTRANLFFVACLVESLILLLFLVHPGLPVWCGVLARVIHGSKNHRRVLHCVSRQMQ
jgi:hypothetical protein